ncbi:GspE/PulE family protein [Aliiglaciecola sp. CAU 1673]|uniref:GspE/PulE family protein n=1 Tax=Aliiglaciecola sp. CAU 1673 TaxID=3032595 RepID=UPI0023D9CB21|nr:GspE/PulE family protein [Aliiglaciecola sp. CAU 1673]MDF2179138.1 GspE/PulE family protein [Aliiglaciecola sp. CAU 1673]
MQPKLKMRLGDLLVHENVISEAQLQQALEAQRQTGRKLGNVLTDLGLLSEDQLLTFLSQQLNVPFIDIGRRNLEPAVVKLLPEVQARRFRAIALENNADHILVGMSDPADLAVLDNLAKMLPKAVRVAVVRESQLLAALDRHYRRTEDITSFAHELASEHRETAEFDFTQVAAGEEDTAVARLLNSIFEDAVQMEASDIHIEPDETFLRIRQRVDGVLQEHLVKERNIASALVLRLKLMCGLDISEKRLPQDGRTHIKIKGHEIDVRISTMPVQFGESVVMRLLDQSAGLLSLKQTGMPPKILERLRLLLGRPHGMILVTGPTGSGKTTTLYGALSELNQPGVKIITVEDPVEYRLPRINQVQVNTRIGLTFANVLRATLRQDPDVIMVGEMRDHETAEIGLRGALTGHLVLSTLHTNDAISSAIRLLDMGAKGYLVASSLRGVIAQRLVRRICERCKQDYQPNADERFWLRHLDNDLSKHNFKHGVGCAACHHTGYRGRIGVFELMEMTEGMMNALKNSDTVKFAEQARKNPSYTSLAQSAMEYAIEGVTSLEEVLKLVEMVAEEEEAPAAS